MYGSKATCERYAPCNGSSGPRFQRNFGRLALGCIKQNLSCKTIEEMDNNISAQISIDRVSATYSLYFDEINRISSFSKKHSCIASKPFRTKIIFFKILLCQMTTIKSILSRLRRKKYLAH